MSKKVINTVSIAVGAALLGSVALVNASNAFQMNDLGQGYMLVGDHAGEGKCGEGKCGEGKKEGDEK